MTELLAKEDWKGRSPEQALRSLESAPVVHGVTQALESSLAVTSASIKHGQHKEFLGITHLSSACPA